MASDFRAISDGLADVVAGAEPFVARVSARRRYPASGIVWSQDGLIVTANHVVRHDENITVGWGKDDVPATLVGRDPSTDLALLRAEAGDLQAASWLKTEEMRVGALVLALGRPGASIEASLGIVSALGEAWRTGGGGKVSHFVKPDLVMYPGFSGGPLVGGDGRVVGLATSALLRDSGVALPAATVEPVVQMLLEHGRVRRGYLGVSVQTVRLPANATEELNQKTGLLITSVEAETPAEASGLLVGDILVAFDNEPVRQPDDLSALLVGRAGAGVDVRLIRGGNLQGLTVTVGERT